MATDSRTAPVRHHARTAPTRAVVVTGMGAVCAVADDCAGLAAALEEGRSGIRPIERFDTSAYSVRTGAEVPWRGPTLEDATDSAEALCLAFAVRAAGEALAQARRAAGGPDPRRVALVFGTGLGDLDRPIDRLALALARRLDIGGPVVTVSTACSSSTGAIGLGRDLITMGAADAVVAGGADVLSPTVFAGFHALGVLTAERCAPFSTPFGTTLGEGAGFLVLEPAEQACARGAEVVAAITGVGFSGDGYHETSPDPKGGGVERALRAALADAGLAARDIGYVNAHGSGTEANDPSEWRGIERGLGRGVRVPVSSTKGALGHAQGAAGALEAIATILMMRRGAVPPTLNFVGARRFAPPDPVGGAHPRPYAYGHALCLNSAFGGANVALVLSDPTTVRATPAVRPTREVSLTGLGLVGPCGLGVGAYESGRARSHAGRVPPFALEDVVPRADPRGLDPSSRYLIAAAALALKEAGLRLTGAALERTGLVVGAIRASPDSFRAFGQSVADRGLPHLSAAAFARIVLNAPAGFCSKVLSLRGPLTAITTGAGGGLAAFVHAAEMLSTREEVDSIVAAAVDEVDPAEIGSPHVEGAVAALLSRRPSDREGSVRVLGWGVAGPAALRDAVERARAGLPVRDHDDMAVFEEASYTPVGAPASATPSALALADATLAIRHGDASRALVTGQGDGVSVAVLLSA